MHQNPNLHTLGHVIINHLKNAYITSLSHARRSARLEWIIIILIAIEIVLFLMEMVTNL